MQAHISTDTHTLLTSDLFSQKLLASTQNTITWSLSLKFAYVIHRSHHLESRPACVLVGKGQTYILRASAVSGMIAARGILGRDVSGVQLRGREGAKTLLMSLNN